MKNSCPFCKELLNRTDNVIKSDRIIAETKSFIVLPTIGGFVDNYLLIVPRKHINCFGELNNDEWQELDYIIDWQKKINRHYFESSTSMFEHGALLPSNESGKSIIHAHLHIFPNNITLFNVLSDYDFGVQRISNITDLTRICRIYENYLYYSDVDGKEYVIIHDEGLLSQFLRKILADSLGISKWNWRKFPYVEKIETCVHFYRTNSDLAQQLRRE